VDVLPLCVGAYVADFSPTRSSSGESLSMTRNDKVLRRMTRFVGVNVLPLCVGAYVADFSPTRSSSGEGLSMARNDKVLRGMTRFEGG
jgi:ribosomal protein S19